MKNKFLAKVINFWPVVLIILFSSIVFHTWVFSFSPVTSGDWMFNDEINLTEYYGLPKIISHNGFGGADIMGLSFFPFNLLTSVLVHFGLTYSAALRFVFLYIIVFVGPIANFFLIKKIFRSNLAALIGALLFQFNPYFLILGNGVLTLMASYSFFPLILLLYMNSLEKNSFKGLLIAGLVLYVASFYEVRGLYLMAPILFGYSLFHIFILNKKDVSLATSLKKLIIYLTPIFLVLLLSFYWIFGLLATQNSGVNSALFNRALFGEGYMMATSSLAQFHPFWAGDYSTNFIIMKVPLRFWLLPLAAILGYFVNRRNKYVLFFGIITFVGIMLSKLSAEPFGNLYKWLFLNIPGFSAFRESSKFYFYTAVGYSVLITGFINYLIEHKTYKRTLITTFLVSGLVVIVVLNARGQFTGRIGGLSVARNMPSDYRILKQYILDQNQYFRLLWLPYYSRWIPNYPQNPKLAANALYYSPWNLINPDKPITVKASEAERFAEMLSTEQSRRLLDASSVKYVIIPLVDKANGDDFFYLFNKPRDFYLSAIKKISYLKPVNINTQEVKVYLNETAKPKMYLTTQPESITEDITAIPVLYQRLSASEYQISLGELSSPMYLQFSEAYDPNWKIFTGTDNWPNIFNAPPLILASDHEANIAGLNTYKIDPRLSNRTIKLYYFPQAYITLGWVLSLGIGLLILVFIMTPNSMALLTKIKKLIRLK